MTAVVVVGGGMAGAACASELGRKGVEVLLIDRNDYLQFQPLLYQVASSQLPVEDVARPLSVVFADHPTVAVVRSPVTAIDFSSRRVTTADGMVRDADHVVLAAGATANFFGVAGADQHAFPLYSIVDAERLRLHLHELLRVHCSPEPPADPLTVVIVGGGPTGVETAGAIAELFIALKEDGHLADSARVHLVDHGHALLKPFTEKSHAYALAKLQTHGVDVTFGVAVTRVDPDSVQLSDGTVLATRTVIWGGGESASPIASSTGATPGRGGRIDVGPDLMAPGFDGVFAIGDVANIPGPGDRTLPQLGSVAQQSGKWAAKNVISLIHGEPTKPFHYHDKGIMAMIGRNAAVAELGAHRHQVEGPIAFAAWLGLHAILLSGTHSRVDAFLNWAEDYFHHNRAPDLELEGTSGRIAWADDVADRPTISAADG
ncbi:NAD(P)/FAD-dependent oxidoreductase [Nakamurella sp. GG22]